MSNVHNRFHSKARPTDSFASKSIETQNISRRKNLGTEKYERLVNVFGAAIIEKQILFGK